MSICRIQIRNYKSIRHADLFPNHVNLFIGENGAGKTNILEAIQYFYSNLCSKNPRNDIFDCNNRFSNQITISLSFNLSEFVKIAKAQSSPIGSEKTDSHATNKYQSFYKTILSVASKTQDNIFVLTLSQVKERPIRWNHEYSDRSLINSLFPLFYLDTRELDIHSWEYLWDVIGEVGKVSNSERTSLESALNGVILDKDRESANKFRNISELFQKANVNIKSATQKEFASSLAKVFFSGDTIQQGGKTLLYYSTGTNSVKYLELLLNAINLLASSKLKEPIILLDEPEISLHPQLVNELTDTICEVSNKLYFFISSHSSRLTKNLIIHTESFVLYNIRLISRYSEISRMNLFPQYSPTSTPRVTDEHVNSYFARGILFVEGETELELFSNKLLQILFPPLHIIDVYKALSDKPSLNIMHPNKNHMDIPFLSLIDMDKAIGYDVNTKKYSLNKEYIPDNQKEMFQFRSKRSNIPSIFYQRRRINAMADKLHIHYYQPLLCTNDPLHAAFVNAVHAYLLNYNVFAFCTTVEGALVNKNSLSYSLDFLKGEISNNAFTDFSTLFNRAGATDKINLLRIVYDGKSDLWQTYKSIKKRLDPTEAQIIDRAFVGKKASGWVTRYINTFLAKELHEGDISEQTFKKIMEDKQKKNDLLHSFIHHFPELYDLLQRVCNMI